MCFLCGNDVSRHTYDLLQERYARLEFAHDALKEQHREYEEKIRALNDEIAALQEKSDARDADADDNWENSLDNLHNVLARSTIFSMFRYLLEQIAVKEYTLNDLPKIDSDYKTFGDNLMKIERISDVKVKRLRQRSWDEGNPIQMGFEIRVDHLYAHEVEVLRAMTRGDYSDAVSADPMDAGHLSLEFDGGAFASFGVYFGLFGNDSSPMISLYVDVFNETLSDTYFKVPPEVENLIARLSFECNINKWASLTAAQPLRF